MSRLGFMLTFGKSCGIICILHKDSRAVPLISERRCLHEQKFAFKDSKDNNMDNHSIVIDALYVNRSELVAPYQKCD